MEIAERTLPRPVRADARRNRERILEAARVAFQEAGVHAQMDDVARRAGVGVGTLYRHFPTKEALVGELVGDKFRLLLEEARAALEVEDPWEAFAGALRRNAEHMAADAVVQDALMRSEIDWTYAEGPRAELQSTFAVVVERAKAAGVIRSDFTIQDVPMLMCGLCSTMAGAGPNGGYDWRRHLELMLDGVRAR